MHLVWPIVSHSSSVLSRSPPPTASALRWRGRSGGAGRTPRRSSTWTPIDRLGARTAFILAAATEATSLLLLGLAPASLAAVLCSAALFGVAYATIVAISVIWSTKVFADRPSAGLAAVMVMNAVGLLIGPPILGMTADHTGLTAIFTAGAVLLALTTAFAPREELRNNHENEPR